MNIYEELKWRGLIQDISDEVLIDKLNNERGEKIMFENNLFEPIKNMEEINRLGCEYQNKLAEYTTLDYSETACLRVINKETKLLKNYMFLKN